MRSCTGQPGRMQLRTRISVGNSHLLQPVAFAEGKGPNLGTLNNHVKKLKSTKHWAGDVPALKHWRMNWLTVQQWSRQLTSERVRMCVLISTLVGKRVQETNVQQTCYFVTVTIFCVLLSLTDSTLCEVLCSTAYCKNVKVTLYCLPNVFLKCKKCE